MSIIHYLPFLLLFQFLIAFEQVSTLTESTPLADRQHIQKNDNTAPANIIFRSADGGQTWLDISKGLPENLKGEGVEVDPGVYKAEVFTQYSGLYLHAGNGLYLSEPNSTTSYWKKEIFPDKMSSMASGKTRIFAYNYEGEIFQKTNGTSVWSPVFTNFREKQVRTVFETSRGIVFIGSDNGLFKSTDNGETWKHVHVGGWVIKLVESNGLMLATSMGGIIRSADNGETWSLVISEGGVGIDVVPIKGGFAAITYNTVSETRRVRTSYDGGKSWQSIDAGLPESPSIVSIIQVGENLFCGHPAGIFKSSDKGKIWKLILPSIDNKVFNLSVSGNVIYAIPKEEGC